MILAAGLALLASGAGAQPYIPGKPITPENPQPVQLRCWNGSLYVSCSSGGGGGTSDTTAANQSTQIAAEQAIRDRLGDITAPAAGTANARLGSIDSRLAGSLTVGTHAVTQSGTWTTVPATAQGATLAGVTGNLSQGAVVTGDQAYSVGTTQPLNLTATGRLKVGLSSATNIVPNTTPATTLSADLVACQYRASPATWSDTWTGSLRCDAQGRVATILEQPLPAGTNSLGTLSGISGTISLPTGAATAAKQPNFGTAGASSTDVLTVQGIAGGTPQPVTVATALPAGANAIGSITNTGFAVNAALPTGTNVIGQVSINQTSSGVSNGVTVIPNTASALGIAPVTAANVSSQVGKASAGNFYGLNVENAAITGTYVLLYNATAAPAAGGALTSTLILWHFLLGSSASLDKSFPVPVRCTVGCTVIYTTSLTTFTAPGTAPLVSTVMVL